MKALMMKTALKTILTSTVIASSVTAAEMPRHMSPQAPQELTVKSVDIGRPDRSTKIDLSRDDLDTYLSSMVVGNDSSMYPIGGYSMASASRTIEKIVKGNFIQITPDELSKFVICVSACLRIEKGDALLDGNVLKENSNVKLINSGQELEGFNRGVIRLNIKDLRNAYDLLKIKVKAPNLTLDNLNILQEIKSGNISAASRFTLNQNNLYECRTQLLQFMSSALKLNHLKFAFVQMTANNHIPYLLLKRNAAGNYEFPTINNEAESCLKHTQNMLSPIGQIQTDMWEKFECFNSPAAIMVSDSRFDEKIWGYYEKNQINGVLPEFIFIRACNIEALTTGVGQSPFYGIDDSNHLFAKWREINVPIDPSVMGGMELFSYLCGFMSRVGDVRLNEIGEYLLKDLEEQRAKRIYQVLDGQKDLVQPVVLYPNYQPVPLSEGQIKAIKDFYETLKDQPNPKRPGVEFTDKELSIGGVMLRVVENNENAYITALAVVFSVDRAKAILNEIVG